MKTTLLRSPFLLAFAAPLAAQATIHVPTDQPTIQLGIAAASDGDTVLVAPGTYVEQIDLLGKAITVRGAGGAAVTTIDSQGADGWSDYPSGAVVRMIRDEGPSTVLEGLTITGAHDTSGDWFYGGRGVHAMGLAPTIRDCVVRDNRGALGAGIAGNATIERCRIIGNSSMPYDDGGGLWGAPTVIDCVISDNRSGGRGGGVYATGPCTITGTVLDSNVAGNGSDGYSGGAVYGPATLVRCAITRNSAHHWFSGGPPDVIGTAVEGAVALDRCTVADNFVAGTGPVPGDESGALRDVGSVTNSILWGDQVASLAVGSTTAVTWSIVEGGWPGTGNLAADPLFVAPLGGDYTLQGGSPAIDAGDPSAPLDPDGTIADMGAYVYLQAAAFPVLGSGVNPVSLTTTDVPALGTTWTASLDATLHHPSTAFGALVGVLQPGAALPTPFGELLLSPLAAPVLQEVAAVSGGIAAFALPVPALADFVGLTVHTQGIAIGAGLELANGIDLLLAH